MAAKEKPFVLFLDIFLEIHLTASSTFPLAPNRSNLLDKSWRGSGQAAFVLEWVIGSDIHINTLGTT